MRIAAICAKYENACKQRVSIPAGTVRSWTVAGWWVPCGVMLPGPGIICGDRLADESAGAAPVFMWGEPGDLFEEKVEIRHRGKSEFPGDPG